MALCHNCDEARIEYIGNGIQTDYDFPFTYNERGDVEVAKWNKNWLVWEQVSRDDWKFLNDTVIRFEEPPLADQKFIIYRCTDLEPLPAEFHPGHAIKAQDLNDNFFVLKSAIEEARCAIQRSDEKAEEKYWNKIPYDEVQAGIKPDVGETIYGNDTWVCTDEAVASTKAICQHVEAEIDALKITKKDVQKGDWIHNGINDDEDHFPTTDGVSERLDPYFQDRVPQVGNKWRLPGKIWFDNDRVQSAVWDNDNRTWVSSGLSGPPGPQGTTGSYSTIVSDTAPTRRVDYTELQNGDVWFNSNTAELYIWYDDGKPSGSNRRKQWVQALGGAGAKGEPGDPGQDGEMLLANLLSEKPIVIDKNQSNKTATFSLNLSILDPV